MSEIRTPATAPRPTRRSVLLLWVIAGAGLILSSLFSLLLYSVSGNANPQLQLLVNSLVYYLPFLALPVFLLVRRTPDMWQSLRPYPISLFSVLSIVSLALVGVFFMTDLTALWTILLEAAGLNAGGSSLAVPTNAPGLMLTVFCVAVLPGVCEEFLFRGVVLPAFERYGTRHAVLVTGAMFALLHGSLTGLPAHFLLGIIIGSLVVCCDSIYAGLIFHTAYNAATLILTSIANRSANAAAEYARMLDAVGGLSGAAALLGEMLLMGAMMYFTLRMFRMTARLRKITFQPRHREPLRASEWALLAAGLLITLLLFAANLLL